MSIVQELYERAASTAAAQRAAIQVGLARVLLGGAAAERHLEEERVLGALRALGDDGTRLEQAVALAACDVSEEQLSRFLVRLARGEEPR